MMLNSKFMLSSDEITKAIRFSYELTEISFERYKSRNIKVSKEKLINDNFIGKLAELYVYHYIRDNKRYAITYPDFNLGFTNEKYIDLVSHNGKDKINIHVKCCRFDSNIKDSWLIEEKEIKNLTNNCYFALCEFYSIDNIIIKKFIKASDVPFKEPKYNLPSKKAIYLADL